MMDISVNLLAVVFAAFMAVIVAALWYSPILFYGRWSRLAGLQVRGNPRCIRLTLRYGVLFAAALASAYVVAIMGYLANQELRNSFFQDTVATALWLWVGVVAVRLLAHDWLERRPIGLTVLNAGYELMALLAMAFVIGGMGY